MEVIEFIENKLNLPGTFPQELFKLSEPYKQLAKIITKAAQKEKPAPILIVKGRQVGMSTFIGALSLALIMTQSVRDKYKIYHLFPSLNMAQEYAKGIQTDLIRGSVNGILRKRNGEFKSCIEEKIAWGPHCDTLLRKKFTNDSMIAIDTSGVNGKRLRGCRSDMAIIDESQMTKGDDAFINIFTCGGLAIHIITPDENNQYTKDLWYESKRNYFYVDCEKCSSMFPLHLTKPDRFKLNYEFMGQDILLRENIIKCPGCKCEFSKERAISRGKWFLNGDGGGDKEGYHFPTILADHVIKEVADQISDKTRFCNEILGDWL